MRENAVALSRMTERQEKHRHGIGERGGDAGVGVFCTRAVLHCEYARGPAVGYAGVAVPDANTHTLLSADDGAYARGGGGLDDRRRGECAQVFNSLLFQNLGYGVDGSHVFVLICSLPLVRWSVPHRFCTVVFNYSSATLMSSLPKFSPFIMPMNAAGAFSMPSTTSSLYFILPSLIQRAMR